jgi:hypothetical protein
MTRQQIENKLKDPKLDSYSRELLLQHLHYLSVEKPQNKRTAPKKKLH